MSDTAGIDILSFGFKGDTSDIDRAAAETEALLDGLARNRKGTVDIDVDAAAATAQAGLLEGALDLTTRDRHTDVDLDTGAASAQAGLLEGELDVATRDRDVDVHVNGDPAKKGILGLTGALGKFMARMKSSTRGQSAWNATMSVGKDISRSFTSSLSVFSEMGQSVARTFTRMGTILLLITSILPQIISLITTLVTAFFSLGAAMAPMFGTLLALPGLFAGAAAGIGALLLGFHGVSKALQAASQAETKAAGTSRRLADAKRALTKANEGLTQAEKDLAAARRAFPETLEDAQFAATQATLDQRQAILDLSDAQKAFNAMQAKTAKATYEVMQQTDDFSGKVVDVAKAQQSATDAGESQARLQLQLRQAELAVAMAKDRHSDAEAALQKLQRGGVEGSAAVVAALKQQKDAEEAVADAKRNVSEAQKNASGQTDAYRAAMAKLTPEGRSFVKFMQSEWLPQWRAMTGEIQSKLLPGIETGMRNMIPTMRQVGGHLADLAGGFGDSFARMTKRLGNPTWVKRIDGFMGAAKSSARNLATALGYIIQGLMDLVIASKTTSDWMSGGLAGGAKKFADAMHKATEKGSGFKKFMESARHTASRVWQIIKNLSSILYSLGKASNAGLGHGMLKDISKVTKGWAESLKTGKGFAKAKHWFKDMKEPIYAVAHSIEKLVKWWTKFSTSKNFIPTLHAIEKIGGAFGSLLEGLGKSNVIPVLLTSFGKLLSVFALLTNHFGIFGVFFGLILTRMTMALGTELGKWLAGWIRTYLAMGLELIKFVGRAIGQFLLMSAKWLLSMASTAAAWALNLLRMGVQLAAFAVKAAAQWLIAMGPIGWVIIAVVALVALIIWKWAFVKKWTIKIFHAVWDKIKEVWDKVKGVFSGLIDWVKKHWPLILAILTGPFGLAVYAIIKHKDAILNGIKSLWNWIRTKFGEAKDWLTKPFGDAKDWIKGKWNDLLGWLGGLPVRVGTKVLGMWDGIKDGFRSMLNSIIGWWNDLDFKIPSFTIPIPGAPDLKIGGFEIGMPDIPTLPAFKMGGRPQTGGLIRAAEDRAELFVLDKPGRIAPNLNALRGGGAAADSSAITERLDRLIAVIEGARGINVNVEQTEHADPAALARAIAWEAGL